VLASNKVCVDASLAIKLVIREPYSDQALALWQSWIENGMECIAPAFFPFEVASVIRGKYVRKQLTVDEAERAFAIFTEFAFTLMTPETLLYKAWTMNRELELPTLYDTAYLALAKLNNCEFWTADKRFIDSLQRKFPWVKWVGGYVAKETS